MGTKITLLEFVALLLAIGGCFALPAILGYWLAKIRLYWLLQALLIFAIASPLMLIRAFDLLLVVLINAFLVLFSLKISQRWQQRKSQSADKLAQQPFLQFDLFDGLAAFVFFAVAAAMWAQAESANFLTGDPSTIFSGVFQCLLLGAGPAVYCGVLLCIFGFKAHRDRKEAKDAVAGRNWISFGKKMFWGTSVMLMIASVVYFFCLMLPPPAYIPIRKRVAGEPNSYPKLVAAGRVLSVAGLGDGVPTNPGPILAEKLQTQSKTFDQIRFSLQAENCFSIDWDSPQFDVEKFDAELVNICSIANAYCARTLQSLSEGQHDDVVADGFRCMKLFQQISMDGNFIRVSSGAAYERLGVKLVVPGIEKASVGQLKVAAKQLDAAIDLFGPLDLEMERVVHAERYSVANAKNAHWSSLLMYYEMGGSVEQLVRDAIIERNVLRQLLRTEIAIRLYQSEFGHFPDSLESLVPDFLDQVPIDDFSKSKTQPFHYKVSDDRETYRLYSAGGDGDDDDGEVLSEYADEGDLDLKILYGDLLADNAEEVEEYEADQAAIASE